MQSGPCQITTEMPRTTPLRSPPPATPPPPPIARAQLEDWISQEEVRLATQASRESSSDHHPTSCSCGHSKRSWADEASSASSCSSSKGQVYPKSRVHTKGRVSFASATTTDEVIEVDATSEPNTYGDNISFLSDGEDSDAGIPSGVVSASSLISDANSNADALCNGYESEGWTYINSEGATSNAIGFAINWTFSAVFLPSSAYYPSDKDDQKSS